jgi:hypothetical protein
VRQAFESSEILALKQEICLDSKMDRRGIPSQKQTPVRHRVEVSHWFREWQSSRHRCAQAEFAGQFESGNGQNVRRVVGVPVTAFLVKPNVTEFPARRTRNRENFHSPTVIQIGAVVTPIKLDPRILIREIIRHFDHPRFQVNTISCPVWDRANRVIGGADCLIIPETIVN